MTEYFDFNDLLIVPAAASQITSRKDINPYHDGFLPLMTAPMDTVVSKDNFGVFINNKIRVCFPRGEKVGNWNPLFTSMSLEVFKNTFIKNEAPLITKQHVLIDIANGHMDTLTQAVRDAKGLHGDNLVIMAGNVANPNTYIILSNAGADYVRVGIGNGGGCLTTMQTGVGYPMASLIRHCYNASITLDNPAKIVADGGMQKYSDIIKALALGADYIMIGNIFNKAIESCGENYLWGKIPVGQEFAEWAYNHGISIHKKFRGMSTKEVQKKWGKEVLTTSEGVVRFREVEYTLAKWVDNFESYLRSAMSYSNAIDLDHFIGYAKTIQITNNAYNRFNK